LPLLATGQTNGMTDDETRDERDDQEDDEKQLPYEGDHARGDQPWAKTSSGDKDDM